MKSFQDGGEESRDNFPGLTILKACSLVYYSSPRACSQHPLGREAKLKEVLSYALGWRWGGVDIHVSMNSTPQNTVTISILSHVISRYH